jgi:hypothetical protein
VRMATRTVTLLVAGFIILASTRGAAHHHIGCANNTETTEMLTGRITQIDWENPHVHIHLYRASTAPGDSTDWIVETQAAYILPRQGLTQTSFRAGDTIQVVLWPAKDGSHQGFTKSITLNDGRTVVFNIAELRCPW